MDKDNDREGNKGGDKYGDEEDSDGSEERGERASSAAGASRGKVNLLCCPPSHVSFVLFNIVIISSSLRFNYAPQPHQRVTTRVIKRQARRRTEMMRMTRKKRSLTKLITAIKSGSRSNHWRLQREEPAMKRNLAKTEGRGMLTVILTRNRRKVVMMRCPILQRSLMADFGRGNLLLLLQLLLLLLRLHLRPSKQIRVIATVTAITCTSAQTQNLLTALVTRMLRTAKGE